MSTRVDDRRLAVMRAVIAIEAQPILARRPAVRAFHVCFYGLAECIDAPIRLIGADLVWLEGQGHLKRVDPPWAEFRSTAAGREWAV